MSYLRGGVAALASLMIVGAATPAAAVVRIVTYTGVIALNGYDRTGEFGAPNTLLTGEQFVATYTYDLSLGERTGTMFSDGLVGGPSLHLSNPMLDTTLTIKGVTKHFAATNYAAVLAQTGTLFHLTDARVVDPDHMSTISTSAGVAGLTPSLEALVPTTAAAGGGNFLIYDYGPGGYEHSAEGQFEVATVTVSEAVPEPATWAVLVLGFAATGAVLRRRRTSAA